ncbi:Type III restriction enzyme, res subunit [Paraliobacillus sp. PM-2]|uniref:DEAD/DEAH box helicase family protein n=1 Tax=Paraliobacillus sp. PM-2 TaxID=1462524 RepID=UPI00061BC19D|nr:DEAD/DEAH box helicase family protein [Paraliobacillus sp. PM-2]CQR46578.1 Type III restriction enzyme, res subunit [Paraliobacillus sp. PM-2]
MKKNKNLLNLYVENYLENLELDSFDYNFEKFNDDFDLFDYQSQALGSIARLLLNYFNDGKHDLIDFYNEELSELDRENINIKPSNRHFNLIKEHFTETNGVIDYKNFINRASFWMATGAGKTFIIVKLIELLYQLILSKLVPTKKILVVMPNNDIFDQFVKHINYFNKASYTDKKITLKSIKEYERLEFAGINPLQPNSLTVYYTKTTHFSDENSENIFDYRSVQEEDGWYIILDEAHKGEAETSIRKHYINILAKNGFLFNFSATFTDDIDVISTIYNFDLRKFITKGYGKNIKVLDEEYKNFKARNKADKNENLDESEKKKIILKSLIVFTAIKEGASRLRLIDNELYHNPLMLTITNEIKTKDADMKLYFKYLAHIASKQINAEEIEQVKEEIINNLGDNLTYLIGEEVLSDRFKDAIYNVSYEKILKHVFKSNSPGEIEVYEIGSNNDELSFRLKQSTNEPFALIKASDVKSWKKDILEDYSFFNDVVTEDSRFKDVKNKRNDINILMGSRQFVEGWDSNRPNIINFINMGISDENVKMILQTIGRGIRIEPLNGIRKRFNHTKESFTLFDKIKRENIREYTELLETLFVFATNKQAIKNIIEGIEKETEKWSKLRGIKKAKIKEELFVPVYEKVSDNPHSYVLSKDDYEKVKTYIDNNSYKLLIVRDNISYETIKNIISKEKINTKDIKSLNLTELEIIRKIESHMNLKSKKLIGFREETEYVDISHYRQIQTDAESEDLEILEQYISGKINKTGVNYTKEQQEIVDTIKSLNGQVNETMEKFAVNSGIDIKKVKLDSKLENTKERVGIELKRIQNHYYSPIIISKKRHLKNAIKERSEVHFLEKLEEFIKRNEILLNYDIDWWYFSKLDEGLDGLSIPYYDSQQQLFRDFFPDFIFWIKKKGKYKIMFIDPKGLTHERNPRDKIKGFNDVFKHNDNDKFVELLYYNQTDSGDKLIDDHCFYDIERIFS